MKPNVIEVTEQTFQSEVIERSHKVPVLVDFWAPWCGPCRMLTPVLESLASESNGAWVLAKVNSDENPGLAQRYGVRGIPNVKAFKNGAVVDEFVGAQPKPAVKRFLEQLLPDQWDESVEQAEALMEQGDGEAARAALEAVVKERPDHEAARLLLAQLELEENNVGAALSHLEVIPARGPYGEQARKLQARARLAVPQEQVKTAKERLAGNPDDLDARFLVAQAAAVRGDYESAAEQLLQILERDRNFKNGAAHQTLLDLFVLLGDEDPRTSKYRQRLGWLLFA